MTQIVRPISVSAPGWFGSVSDISDGSDLTFVGSPLNPQASQPLDVTLPPMNPPGSMSGLVITVRTGNSDYVRAPRDLTVQIIDGDTSAIVATETFYGVEAGPLDLNLSLTPAEAAAVNYGHTRIRITAQPQGGYLVTAAYEPDGSETGYRADVYNSSGTLIHSETVGLSAYSAGVISILIPGSALTSGFYAVYIVAVNASGETSSDYPSPLVVP